MVHHFQWYILGGSPVPFFYPVIPTQNFLHSRNPEGYFSTSHLPWCFQSRILPRFFLTSLVPSFKYREIPDPENLLGALYQAVRGLEFVRAPNYEAFLKISINLRSHDHFKVMIYLKNLWKQVAIKWRGYWSKFSLCKCRSSSTLPRKQRRHYLRYLCHSFVVNMRLESPTSMYL